MNLKKHINKENLLTCGKELLMEQGYHGTGLQQILDAAEIPKGSFYNYFANKETYTAEIIQYYVNHCINNLANLLKNPDMDALSALNCYFNSEINRLEEGKFKGGCLLGNLMGEISDTSKISQESLQLAANRYQSIIANGLKRAQAEGTVRTDKSADDMAELFFNGMQGAILRVKIDQTTEPFRQCVDNLLNEYFKN